MAIAAPRVFTIPASAPFLPTLVEALFAGALVPGFFAGSDPLVLGRATIYLPTRRACRLARDTFLDALKSDAAILPRILPIGDIDEDELVFADAATGPSAAAALEIPPALGGLERRMLLAQLVLEWARSSGVRGAQGAPLVTYSPASALALADNLARLMDDMTTRRVPWERLDTLVPEDFDKYWQLTLEFLKIARDAWPAILAAHQAIEPAQRRDLLIAAEAKRLATTDGPVIAAGSTGSMPATAALLATIATLPHGAVVLPGLDTDLAETAWNTIAGDDAAGLPPSYGHPQFAMHGLLKQIGIGRNEVMVVGMAAPYGREKIVSQALCPAAASECWQQRQPAAEIERALSGVKVIEAATAEEEALAVAIALREAIEQPGRNAALVTPDRALARRVMAALTRWNVAVDDSRGDRLAETPAGVFARLVAEAAIEGLPPASLLALLKHPLTRLGLRGAAIAATTNALELAILHGPRPRRGADGLRHALASFRAGKDKLYRTDPRKNISEAELDQVADLIERLAAAIGPLEELVAQPRPLADIAQRHRDAVAALTQEKADASSLTGDDGIALMLAFDEMAAAGARFVIAPADYPEMFAATISDRAVRHAEMAGARVKIFGLLEARLQNIDTLVLGGLVEGTWPPDTRNDAWLSRPMRQKLGLDLPERRVGLTAHDFAQSLGACEVYLSRAAKLAGTPTLWSRFAQRLAAVAGQPAWREANARGAHYVALARALDRPAKHEPIAAPAPKPPVETRPAKLSITEIENWLRDPYTIYAKHILKLVPIDAIDTPPGAADRGSAIHDAIGEFTRRYANELPDDAAAQLTAFGEKFFAPLADFAEERAFWWPRFKRIAQWFAGWETERRTGVAALHAEIRGESVIAIGERTFTLTGRADRIERLADGSYAILDYKTGAPPSERLVRCGFSPQLTLEAAMLRRGGFKEAIGAAGASVRELAYVRLSGGEPAGDPKILELKEGNADTHAETAWRRLTEIATIFASQEQPYRSLVHPMWKTRYGDYDHLARVKEWSLTAGEIDLGFPE